MSHLIACHPDYAAVHNDAQRSSMANLPFETYVSEMSVSLYGWMDLVVAKHLPFSIVEDKTFRRYSNLNPTTAKTLCAAMHKVGKSVEAKIEEVLPARFGVVLDGWSSGGTAYCCVMATFCTDGALHSPMLAFAPMLDEGDLSAHQHVEFLKVMLELYRRDLGSITFVVGDNCSVNQAMARELDVPLVGCASHRLNLAVRKWMERHEHVLDRIQAIMIRARTVKNRAALRALTHLAPRLRNDTRWSSSYEMVHRFFEIKDALAMVPDLRSIFPCPGEVDQMGVLRDPMDVIQSFTLAFERNDLKLNEARALMDVLCDKFPSMSHHLGMEAEIVKNPLFESAVVRVLDGHIGDLTDDERISLRRFEVATVTGSTDIDTGSSECLAMDILRVKRAKVAAHVVMGYEDLRCVLPTSNIVERMFSKAKLVFAPLRQRMTPESLEITMFLGANRAYWNVTTVEEARRST
ncbi:hypothetical protein DYB25_009153 [Aphanomyces astaci]|uniref:HAT C-terminal dimerisation domain-containing protein n=1 Tax=Aphanomyces astaci TaxID=112090 RepID=A0A397BT53_APHAT|nr:hypothetical protein DYB25_009153 [Aphanomyces astaci]